VNGYRRRPLLSAGLQ